MATVTVVVIPLNVVMTVTSVILVTMVAIIAPPVMPMTAKALDNTFLVYFFSLSILSLFVVVVWSPCQGAYSICHRCDSRPVSPRVR